MKSVRDNIAWILPSTVECIDFHFFGKIEKADPVIAANFKSKAHLYKTILIFDLSYFYKKSY